MWQPTNPISCIEMNAKDELHSDLVEGTGGHKASVSPQYSPESFAGAANLGRSADQGLDGEHNRHTDRTQTRKETGRFFDHKIKVEFRDL